MEVLSQRRRLGRPWEPEKVSELPRWKPYQRLQVLLRDAGEIREASEVCVAGLDVAWVPVPRALISRYKEGDPRPPWARAVLSKSPDAARVFSLHLLIAYGRGEDPDSVDNRTVRRWLRDARSDGRSLRRSRNQVNQIMTAWNDEARVVRSSEGWRSAEDAWWYPRPRYQSNTVDVPAAVWRGGWYLVLTKGELGWLLASLAVQPDEARNAMRQPLFGFTERVVGLELVKACYHPGPRKRTDASSAVAQHLLSEQRVFPQFDLLPDETPLAAFAGRLRGEEGDVFTLVTSRRIVARRADFGLYWGDSNCVDIAKEAVNYLQLTPDPADHKASQVRISANQGDVTLVGVPTTQIADGKRGWLTDRLSQRP